MPGSRTEPRVFEVVAMAILLVALTTGACKSSAPAPAPSPLVYPVTGTWVGRMLDDGFGEGTLRLVLASPAADGVFRGTWSATFPAAHIVEGQAEAISLLLDPNRLVISLLCASGGSASLFGTLDGSRITGPFIVLGCEGLVGGTVELTKQ